MRGSHPLSAARTSTLEDDTAVGKISFLCMIALHLTREELNAAHPLATRQPACRPYGVFAAVDGPLSLFSAQWARNIRTNAHEENLICLPQSPPTVAKEKAPIQHTGPPCPRRPLSHFHFLTFCAAVFWGVYLRPHNITQPPRRQGQMAPNKPPPLEQCKRGPHRCGAGPEIVQNHSLIAQGCVASQPARAARQPNCSSSSILLTGLTRPQRSRLRRI